MITRPVGAVAVSVLFGSSLWFSANGVADGLARAMSATPADIGLLTSAVQLGFIIGSLAIAFAGLADRFRASRLFIVSAVMGAVFNAIFALISNDLTSALVLRFLVGVSIAGIYPVGMKLMIGWAPARAGVALSMLIAALILGTALPHALRWAGAAWDWRLVLIGSSVLSLAASAMIYRLGDGPHFVANGGARPRFGNVLEVLRLPQFRSAAFGYFGHMWELYAFWTLVPMLIVRTAVGREARPVEVSALSFIVIAVGSIGSVWGGALSGIVGSARVAAGALAISGACCVVFAFAGAIMPPLPAMILFVVWGLTVATDSPHFSALAAAACPPQSVGSALAIQNAIGFAITLASIALVTGLVQEWGTAVAWLLLPGPALGLLGSKRLWTQ